jgi:hypothetical protein
MANINGRVSGRGGGVNVNGRVTPSVIPNHITASAAALTKIAALTEKSKTTALIIPVLGDSNHTPGTFNAARWERDNFARLLDQQMAWMRGNSTSMTEALMGPQTQVIKFSTMGNATANSAVDTPWHPDMKRVIGEPRTTLGPSQGPYGSLGGWTAFDNPANTNRFIGFIVDRTSTGEDWELNMDRVAVKYWGGATGQTFPVANNTPVKANGTAYTAGAYTGNPTTFTLNIVDLTGIDVTTIPAGGWNEADATCIALKTAILAVVPTATVTVNPMFGTSGANMPGFLSAWCAGMTAGKKWAVTLEVADGASNMGAYFEYLILDDSTRVGGVKIIDESHSGNAITVREWRRKNATTGVNDATFGVDPFTGSFTTCCYAAPSFAAPVLMFNENTYGISGWFGASGWDDATTTQHNILGLDAVVIPLYVNDLNASSFYPVAIQAYVDDQIKQIARTNSGAMAIFCLPPCPGWSGGDNNRDNWFTGNGGARAKDSAFRDAVKAAVAATNSNAIVMDHQAFYGNVAPTVLKGRIGHFGTYKRETADPIDTSHYKTPTWQMLAAKDISDLFRSYCYQ